MRIVLNQINNARDSLTVFIPGNQLVQDQYTLINDKDNPGSYQAYSTNENGIKGWYDFPTELFKGTEWLYGDVDPIVSQGKDRDFFLNVTNNNVFCKDFAENHAIDLSTSTIHVSSFRDNDPITYDPDNMIDGNESTNWSSDTGSLQTVTFNLGAEKEELIDSLYISFAITEVLTNYEIDLLGSNDGVNFAHIHEVYNGNDMVANTTLTLPADDFMKYRFIQFQLSHEDEITTNHFVIPEIRLNGRTFNWQQIGSLGGGVAVPDENWQIISASQTAVNNEKYAVDTVAATVILSLPENPGPNEHFFFNDAMKNFHINSLFINRAGSGELIQGDINNLEINSQGADGEMVYVGGSIGWMIVNGF